MASYDYAYSIDCAFSEQWPREADCQLVCLLNFYCVAFHVFTSSLISATLSAAFNLAYSSYNHFLFVEFHFIFKAVLQSLIYHSDKRFLHSSLISFSFLFSVPIPDSIAMTSYISTAAYWMFLCSPHCTIQITVVYPCDFRKLFLDCVESETVLAAKEIMKRIEVKVSTRSFSFKESRFPKNEKLVLHELETENIHQVLRVS